MSLGLPTTLLASQTSQGPTTGHIQFSGPAQAMSPWTSGPRQPGLLDPLGLTHHLMITLVQGLG